MAAGVRCPVSKPLREPPDFDRGPDITTTESESDSYWKERVFSRFGPYLGRPQRFVGELGEVLQFLAVDRLRLVRLCAQPRHAALDGAVGRRRPRLFAGDAAALEVVPLVVSAALLDFRVRKDSRVGILNLLALSDGPRRQS